LAESIPIRITGQLAKSGKIVDFLSRYFLIAVAAVLLNDALSDWCAISDSAGVFVHEPTDLARIDSQRLQPIGTCFALLRSP
jgi:hypothetical protein